MTEYILIGYSFLTLRNLYPGRYYSLVSSANPTRLSIELLGTDHRPSISPSASSLYSIFVITENYGDASRVMRHNFLLVFTMSSTNSYWMIGFALMCVITIVGCAAHIVLLLVVLSVQNLRQNPSNSFILTLSLTGFLATSIVFPSAIAIYFDYKSGSTKWLVVGSNCSNDQNVDIPWGMCSALQVLHNFSIYNSAWLVSAIAIERNVSITRPFYAASTLKYALLNATVTACSMLLSLIPILLPSDVTSYSPYAYRFQDPILSWLQLLMVYLIPSITVVVMYLNIYRVAQNVQRTIQPTPSLFSPTNETTPRIWTVNPVVVSQTESNATLKTQRNKAIRTLVLTIGSYIVLWSPYWILNMIPIVHHEDLQCDAVGYITNNGSITVTWLMYASISINPLLYGLLNRAIRTEIKGKMQMTKQFLFCKNTQTEAANQEEHGANAAENFWEFLERTNSPLPA